jgi:hypothetical protein
MKMRKAVAKRRKRASTGRSRRSRVVRWKDAIIRDYPRLIALPNVERVAIGWKERKGQLTARMAVKIYVAEKKAVLAKDQHLPKHAAVLLPIRPGIFRQRMLPTDVVWHAPARFIVGPTDFLNPALSGAMIGIPGRQAGTLACLVANTSGQTFAITAAHVVQNLQGNVIPGIQVLQPPTSTPGMPPGASPLFGRTAGGFFGLTPSGFADFAVLQLFGQRSAGTDALDGLQVQRQVLPSNVIINNRVPCSKFGAATGRTFGAFAASVPSMVVNGVTVTDVLEFIGLPGHVFAAEGDSGALVVSNMPNTTPFVIGILFAATPPAPDAPAGRGFVIPFERVNGLRPV